MNTSAIILASLLLKDELKFKDTTQGLPSASGSSHHNPDKKGYKTIEELELGETNLKYSLRRWVAGALTACAAVILFVFLWHIVMPQCLRWLPADEITALKSLALTLFGALAMSIATLFYTKK